jgi:hypothetical protein
MTRTTKQAARIVCQHPNSTGYEQVHHSVIDCEVAIARIETLDRAKGGCDGPHTIEVWRDGGWAEVER